MGKIASTLAAKEHLDVFAKVADHRFSQIDLSPLLVYLVDTVPSNILPFLAEQLDADGIKGIAVADTEEQAREIIRRSIELHRYKGTVFGVREAIKSVGFVDIELLEGVTDNEKNYSGAIAHTGSTTYSFFGASPFNFAVVLDASDVDRLTPEKRQQLIQMINEYKNIRSRLISILYREVARVNYNARVLHDATINYDYELYILNVNI